MQINMPDSGTFLFISDHCHVIENVSLSFPSLCIYTSLTTPYPFPPFSLSPEPLLPFSLANVHLLRSGATVSPKAGSRATTPRGSAARSG